MLILGGAALAGIAQFLPAPESGALPMGQILGIIGVGLALVGGLWIVFVETDAAQALEGARQAIDAARATQLEMQQTRLDLEKARLESESQEDALRREAEWYAGLYLMSAQMREYVSDTFSFDVQDYDFDDDIDRLLTQTGHELGALMDFESGEHWTISVYLFRKTDQDHDHRLHCVSTLRADRAREQKRYRSWGLGEGVVGYAFQARKEIIVEDARDLSVAGWILIPERLKQEDDFHYYVSMVGVPIQVDHSDEPIGVVMATSDRAKRFAIDEMDGRGTDEIEPLRLLADMVALMSLRPYVSQPQITPLP